MWIPITARPPICGMLVVRVGFFGGDALLGRLQANLRTQAMRNVDSERITHLGSLGISIDWQTGVMSLDKEVLREVLEGDSQAVRDLFQGREDHEGFTGVGRRLE